MAAPAENYYSVLGISRGADAKAIKEAFRTLAMKYHPDRNKEPGAEEKFKKIAEAYAILSDPKKRADYEAGQQNGQTIPTEDVFKDINFEDLFRDSGFEFDFGSSLFERLFGRGRKRRTLLNKGEDIQLDLAVPLARVAYGGTEKIQWSRPSQCDHCGGQGAEPGSSPRRCETCHGTGHSVVQEQRQGIFFQQSFVCRACGGRGTVIDHPCSVCGGTGQWAKVETLKVKIPAGIEEGTVLRIAGHGYPSPLPKGVAGDLLIVVRSQSDPTFIREGLNLRCEKWLSVPEAVLGTHLSLSTFSGAIAVTVPPGIQTNTVLRVRDKGLPKPGGSGHGDLLIRITVQIPKNLPAEELLLYQKIREFEAKRPR